MITYTVHGAFSPSPTSFQDKAEAIKYAESCVNDWARDVYVVKSEIIWRSNATRI